METVLGLLGAGDSVEEVLEEYPALTREDVVACVDFSDSPMGDSIWKTPAEILEVVERRMEEYRRDPSKATTLQEIEARIRGR